MKISNLSPWARRSAGLSLAVLAGSSALTHRAHADERSWPSQAPPIHPPAEEILLVDNPGSTVTAIIQIKYAGPSYAGPSRKFAWVIPVPGKPTLGVSSNAVLERLDAATAPQYWVEVALEGTCMHPGPLDAAVPSPPDAAMQGSPVAAAAGPRDAAMQGSLVATLDAGSGPGDAPSAYAAAPGVSEARAPGGPAKGRASAAGVQVIDRGSVGPYDYVTLRIDPAPGDPAKVATDWLAASGYEVAGLDRGALRRRLREGLHLLALKLAGDADVGAIRPVILTYESKLPMVPMQPMAAAARGVQVWVVGPSQAVPDNARSLVLNDALLDWPTGRKYVAGTLPAGGVGPFDPYYASKPGNYDAVVTTAAREAGGPGFVTELGAPASEYRGKVWSPRDDQHFTAMSSQRYADGIDAILTASGSYRGWDGWKDAIEGATTLPASVTIDEFGRNPDRYRGAARVEPAKFFQLLDEKVIRPVADAAAMLSRAPYLTRLYGVMAPDETTIEPAFDYNPDLALVSDIHIARQFVECKPMLDPHDAPWRMRLPQGGAIAGKGGEAWPMAAGSMPANLKIVQLTTTGPGAVIQDNSDVIGTKMVPVAGPTGSSTTPNPPQNGVMIGGTQTVTPTGQSAPTESSPAASTQSSSAAPRKGACSVSRVGSDRAGSAPALWLLPAGVILALRRRRSRRGRSRKTASSSRPRRASPSAGRGRDKS